MFLRLLPIMMSIGLLPLAAILCRATARVAVHFYASSLGGRTLPVFTQTWLVGQARSFFLIWIAVGVSLALAASAYVLLRKPDSDRAKLTGLLYISAIAHGLSFLMIAFTYFAGFLPLIGGPLIPMR